MRTLLGAAFGYLAFALIAGVALFALTSWADLETLVASGQRQMPALWVVTGLFVAGGAGGIAGRIAARVGDRSESALLVGLVVAIHGLSLLSGSGPGPDAVPVGLMSTPELLSILEMPEWYRHCLPLFAAAFIAYGGYLRQGY